MENKNKSRESDAFTEIAPLKVDYKKEGVPEIFVTAFEGDLNNLQKIIKDSNISVVSVFFLGRSLLHAASEGGYPEIIVFLIGQGIPVDIMDDQGNTPLHLAVWNGKVEAVISLLKSNANVNLPNKTFGMTALHYAACIGNNEVNKVLCDSNCNVNAVDSFGRTPLHYACIGLFSDTIRILIRKKANLDITDKFDKTPLDIVYEKDEFDLMTIMANNGADISKFYDEKWNAKLRKIKEDEENSSNQENVDFYGFLLREDSKPVPNQRDIKKKHIKKWNNNIELTPQQIPKKRRIRITKRIYKDRLPNNLRTKFWMFCLQLDEVACTELYKNLGKKKLCTEDAIQIDKDINRTIRYHQFYKGRYGEGECKLFRVLKAYALYNEETRYTQGMSTIAAILLLYIPKEELAFGALKEIFSRYSLNEWYANSLSGLQHNVFPVFEALVQQHLPNLHAHLNQNLGKNMDVEHYSGLFVTNWFLEIYFDSLPWNVMLSVWDTFLWVGAPTLYSVGLSILSCIESELLSQSDVSNIIRTIKGTNQFPHGQKKILKKAFNYKITQATIDRLKSQVVNHV